MHRWCLKIKKDNMKAINNQIRERRSVDVVRGNHSGLTSKMDVNQAKKRNYANHNHDNIGFADIFFSIPFYIPFFLFMRFLFPSIYSTNNVALRANFIHVYSYFHFSCIRM